MKIAQSLFHLFFIVLTSKAQLTPNFPTQIDGMMNDYVKNRYLSGVVLVARNGKVIYHKPFGHADKEKSILHEPGTNFNIASAGKTFTAVMIMQLVQEGKINLAKPISTYLPDYAIKNADKITTAHLLNHTSGINNYMQHPRYSETYKSLKTLDDVMKLVVDMPLTNEVPGIKLEYSNSGFIILGKIIEEITGESYEVNLEKRVFKKAGITNSYIHYPATFKAPQEAVPYYIFSPRTFINAVEEEWPGFSDGGMQSNAMDLFRFAQALLDGKLLDENWKNAMWTGRQKFSRNYYYGYGWMESINPFGKKIVGHGGGGKGFSSEMRIITDDSIVVVILANDRQPLSEIFTNLLNLIYKGDYEIPKKLVHTFLFQQIEEKGWEHVKNNLAAVLKENQQDSIGSIRDYINIIDMLMTVKNNEAALGMALLAQKQFPNELPGYFLAGNIYWDMGEKDKAREMYRGAEKINPNDPMVKGALKRFEGQ